MSMTSSVKIAALIAAAVGLGACQTTEDPSQAGFFSGVGNLASGTYDQRISDREAAVARTEAQADLLARRAGELESERQSLEAQEFQARQRLASVNSDIATQQARLTSLRQQQAVDQSQLSQLQERIDALQRRRNELAANPEQSASSAEEIAQLEREITELRQVIDSIIATVAVPE